MRVFPLTSVLPEPLDRHGKRTSLELRVTRRTARTLATLPIVLIVLLAGASAALAAQATVVANGLTEPSGAIVDPEGHIWVSDGNGFCETTAMDGSGTLGALLTTVCDANVTGVPASANGGNVVLMPDGKRGASIHRLTWDAGAHSYFEEDTIPLGHTIPAAVSIGPDGAAYVSFTRQTVVQRVANATGGSPGPAEDVGNSAAARPAGMAAGWNAAHTKTVVYIAESKGGVSELDPAGGAAGVATPTEFGAATLGATPPQFSAVAYDAATDTVLAATSLGALSGFPDVIASMSVANPHNQNDSAATGFSNVGGMAVAPSGNVLVTDDPSGTGAGLVGRLLSTGVPDSTAPTLTIDSPFENVTTSSSPSIAFHANEAASFSCRLDTGAFVPCSSPLQLSGLAPGTHTVDVQATDTAGNPGAVVSRHFVVRVPAGVPAGTPAGQVPGAGALAGSGVAGANNRSAPRLTLHLSGGRARLRGRTIALSFSCSATCVARVSGTIAVRRSAQLYRVRGASTLVRSGHAGRLVVRLPLTALGPIRRALRQHKVVQLRLSITTEDAAGNARTRAATVRVVAS
jgi:hypothetical protein